MESPFRKYSWVKWSEEAPKTWSMIWTSAPMQVISSYWHDGTPSEFLMKFVERFGGDRPARQPGWIITVEYDVDSTNYYNPPLSTFFGKRFIQTEIHEMWLTQI